MERIVRTPDGRTLAVQEGGDPAGRPLLVHPGKPSSSRHQYGPFAADAAGRGLRVISYDRPGYGGSDSLPGRTTADCADDVRAICAALAIDRLVMWGWSAGGPYVLACAALLPDLVAAVASLASLAPNDADGLYDDDSRLLLTDPAAARAELDKNREQILAASVSEFVQGFESVMSPADAVVVTGEWAEFLAYSAREALTPGSQGWWDDDRSAVIPWGFELASISIPVLLMHGRQDWFVPVSHGEWLAAHIPAVTARFLPDDGHLTLVNRLGEVHSWLAEYL